MGWIAIALVLWGMDTAVKSKVEKKRALGEETYVCKGKLLIRKLHNRGFCESAMQQKPDMVRNITGAMFGAACGAWVHALRSDKNRITKLGLTCLIGGGANNFSDRMKKGYVVDYFSFNSSIAAMKDLVFNLSDMFIFVGGILTLLGAARKNRK